MQTVGALLSPTAKAITRGGIQWSRKHSVYTGLVTVETQIPDLRKGVIRMHVRKPAASQPRLQYLIGNAAVRRLCVNEPHPPFGGTHKHMINPQQSDEDAYEPTDIPVPALAPRVAPGVYRAILEAFIRECQIEVGPDFEWIEPGQEA
jgi:hypothetical protein